MHYFWFVLIFCVSNTIQSKSGPHTSGSTGSSNTNRGNGTSEIHRNPILATNNTNEWMEFLKSSDAGKKALGLMQEFPYPKFNFCGKVPAGCCSGTRNNSCISTIKVRDSNRTCYCDEECVNDPMDCCPDYLMVCKNIYLPNRPPLFLVPGFLSSRLELSNMPLRLEKRAYCGRYVNSKEWKFKTWFCMSQVLFDRDAAMEMLSLRFDSKNNETYHEDGIETEVLGFGNVTMVETYLSDIKWKLLLPPYLVQLANTMRRHGYENDVDLFALPYDFRTAPGPQGMRDYFEKSKMLIEKTVNATGKRVAIFAHSLGGVVMHRFLKIQSQEWKENNIEMFIPVGAAWGGAMKALLGNLIGILSEDAMDCILDRAKLAKLVRTFPGSHWVLPLLNSHKGTIASIGRKNYTASTEDIAELLKLFSGPEEHVDEQIAILKHVRNFVDFSTGVGVKTHCVFSTGVTTPAYVTWEYASTLGKLPCVKYENGDGLANYDSLNMCARWENTQTKELKNLEHGKMVVHKDLINYMGQLLIPSYENSNFEEYGGVDKTYFHNLSAFKHCTIVTYPIINKLRDINFHFLPTYWIEKIVEAWRTGKIEWVPTRERQCWEAYPTFSSDIYINIVMVIVMVKYCYGYCLLGGNVICGFFLIFLPKLKRP